MSWRDGLTEIKYVDPIKSDDWRNGLLPVGESAEPAGETARENNRAAMRRTTAGREDDWLDIGRKFFERLGPNLKAGFGGAVQGIIETAAATPPPNAPLTSGELYDFNKRATEGIKAARELGVVPGQKLYADAARDLQDNAYRPGNTGFKKYIPMVAESVVQMAPAVAASIVSRNPNVGGAIMGAQVAGQQYGESAASGRDTGRAFQDAVFMGAAEAIGEKIPIGILMKPGGKFLSSTLKAAGAEGLQEMFTQALQSGYDMGRLHPDMTWGEAWEQMKDAGIVGAFTGGSINVAIQGGRLARDGIRNRPIAAGKREQATAAGPTITPEDEASPIPTETIAKGKAATADAMAKGEADTILSQNGTPGVGKRVSVKMPDGTTKKGTVSDAFDEDAEGGRATGIKIDFDDGSHIREHFDTLADAGVEITEDDGGVDPQAYGSELDQALAEAGIDPAAPTSSPIDAVAVTTTASDPERDRKAKRTKGTGTPIANAQQLTQALFPDARVTSWKRDPNDKLTKANPTSWHAHSGAAVDVAPIKGMTFEQFVQKYRDAGYSIIEALNETGAGRSKHATGDHWHIVLGTGGRDASNAPGAPAPAMAAEDMGFGQQAEAAPEAAPDAPASTGQEFLQAAQRGTPIDVRYEDAEDVALTANNRGVPVKYGVVELGSLVASNDVEGRTNPNYPQALQPRDRTRAVSQAQIAGIAANLNPRLLSRSPKASDGTPIIATDGVVESGNGRTIALQRAYAMGGDRVDAYKSMIEAEGFDISGMQQPVLVRVRQGDMTDQDVLAYTAEANARETLDMSDPEQAMADARAMTPDLLDLFREGDIDSVANFPFRKAFLQKVVASPNEFSKLVSPDGQMTQGAMRRVHGAFLAAAYENSDLVNQAVEATDTHIRTIINALTDVAGPWAQLRAAIRSGDIDAAMDITANLNEAVQLIDRARREGKKIGDLVNQADIFSGDTVSPVTKSVLTLFFDKPDFSKPVGRARLVSSLRLYIDGAMNAQPAGASLFGDALEPLTPKDILETAKRKQKNEPESEAYLFAAQPASDAGRAEPGGPAEQSAERSEPVEPVGSVAPESGPERAGRDGAGIPQRDSEADRPGDVAPSEIADATVEQSSKVEISDNSSGKSITIKGASEAQLAQIRDAIPNAKPLEPKLTSQYPEASGAIEQAIKVGVPEQRIHDLMENTYGNYEYEDARNALIAEVAKMKGEQPRQQKANAEWVAFPANLNSMGIPRADMPQIKAEHRGALTQFLKARGVEHSESMMRPRDLVPTQAEYSPAKVEQAKAFEGGDRAILVGLGGRILDGHHQWMAAMETAPNTDIRVIWFNEDINRLIELANEFPSSTQAEGATEAAPAKQDPMAKPLFSNKIDQGDIFDAPRADKAAVQEARDHIQNMLFRYASGMSRRRDLVAGAHGLGGSDKMGVGVDVGELSRAGMTDLAEAVIDWEARAFVDSGAFSLFKKQIKDGDVEALDFNKILDRYDMILMAIDQADPAEKWQELPRGTLLLVMPDVVGDQAASLDLLSQHRRTILPWTRQEVARPIVPLQKGAMTLAEAYRTAVDNLGSDNFIVGIPSNEAAVSAEDVREFVREARPKGLHFLGALSPKKLGPKMDALAEALAETGHRLEHLSADANLLRARLYGRQEGTRTEKITEAMEQADAAVGSRNGRYAETPSPAPSTVNMTLGGKADDVYTAADVGPMTPGLIDGVKRASADPSRQLEILDAIERGLIRDGDMLAMGSPRWALENGYADIGLADGTRRGRITEAGRARLAQLRSELKGDAPAPAPGPQPAKPGLGQNVRGAALEEDENGVRSYVSKSGIRIQESVELRPVRGGGYEGYVDPSRRTDEFLTTDELAEKNKGRAPTPSAPTPTEDKKPAWGANNKSFTQSDLDAARALLASKRNQLNSGFDPDIARAGMTIMGFHIEAGARAFIDAARATAQDLGMTPAELRNSLRSWYMSARIWMEDNGLDISGTDDDAAVKVDLSRIDQWGGSAPDLATAPESGTSPTGNADGLQTDLPRGDAQPSSADAQRAAENGRDGVASGQEVEGGARAPRAADGGRGQADERPAPQSEPVARSGGASSGDNAGLPGLDPKTGGFGLDLFDTPVRTAAPKVEKIKGQNWRIEPGALDEARGPQQKARDNIRAIELIKELDREGRVATAAEQAEIARYVGWGGLKNAFPDASGNYGKGFETVGPRLRELLTDEEYDTARRSIQYAHYTSETIVRNMWDLAKRLGFNGGSVFEPGMGTGNFAGMMPADVAAQTRYQGIEYDHLTSRIAYHLYPQWGVRQADYTRVPQVIDAFDLVIGNPPFSETVIQSDPAYAGKGFVLHDYFFAKSLDAVRPGGLLMFVTSAGTMNKLGTSAREYMADRAELVGAIRLPGNAFAENAGTSVTTDIVVLRKLLPGETASRAWVDTRNVSLPKKDGDMKEGAVSAYFLDNPGMILGEQGFFDKLVAGGERYAVRAPKDFDLSKAIAAAAGQFPVNVMREAPSATAKAAMDFDTSTTEKKDGSFYLDGDRLMQVRNGIGAPIEKRGKGVSGGVSAADQERIKRLIPIRDALRDVYAADLAADTPKSETARKALNRAYDAFVAKHGPINKADISYRRPNIIQQESARNAAREEERLAGREWDEGSFDPTRMLREKSRTSEIARARDDARKAALARGEAWSEGTFKPDDMPDIVIDKRPNIDPFMDDQEGYRLRAIEHYNDDTGEAKKGLVFFENVITRERAPSINSVQDALLYSLNRTGAPDIKYIADLSKKTEAEVIDALEGAIFRVPGTDNIYQTREKYLSGNVREKLAHARQEAERDPSLRPNVTALEAVQPMPLGPVDIAANLGMPWLPADVISEFGTDGLGLKSFKATYQPRLATWSVSGDHNSAQAKTVYGTEDREAPLLLTDALNRQTPKVYREHRGPNGEKQRVLDEAATQAAQDKLAEIKAKFSEWIWADAARTEKLVKLYNEEFNSLVAPVYDGSYLTTPGIAATWSWRPHQTAVVARIIQSGNTYMAHAVGAGKTSAMIGAGMEMRRLGLVKKPMYAVPNHMLGQFTKEFYEQYPTARIAVADERQFHTSRRKQFIANVASDDLDAVIITHSAFGFIPLSEEFTDNMIQDQIEDYRDLLSEIGKDQEQRFTRRRVEQQIEALEQRLSGRGNRKRDEVFTFEEMGVDFLFVDEAHLFRKLDFTTKMANVKGVDPSGSKAAFDLYAKLKYLEGRTPGRSAVLASGTPITNTMAELYSLSRYLQEHELEARGLAQFDAWAGAFGDTQTVLEQDPAGGYKPVTRFAKFVNVPELSVMVRQVMDVVTPSDLEKYVTRPQLKGGKRQMMVVEQTDRQSDYQDQLKRRMEAIQKRKGPPKKGDDILLSVINDGRKSAIDYRLIDASAPKEDSKLERMIDNAFSIWERTKRQPFHKPEADGYSKEPVDYGPAAQMIFADHVGEDSPFPLHRYISAELARRGVPKDQIAIIADYKSHVARQRLFNDMNEGKVRFLIGSVPKMGTGVNAQRRLYALHNMDAQWYPANDEQRNGRIIRQGNMNPEIEIFDYSTKGTYDSTMWGLMETKARFIEGFMRGDPTLRDMDDLGEASQYEQAKAMTTSDPRIMVLTEWKQDLEKAVRRRSAFDRNLQSVKERIDRAEYRIRKTTDRVAGIRKDLEQRVDISGDNFKGKVGTNEFAKRADFGEAALARLDELATKEQYAQPDKKIAEVGGFGIYGGATLTSDGYGAAAYIRFNGAEEKLGGLESALGFVASIQSKISNLESELSWQESLIEQDRKEIADFTPQLDQKFTGQTEIDDLQARVTKLEGELAAESKKASDALQQSIEDGAEIVIDGKAIDGDGNSRIMESRLEDVAAPVIADPEAAWNELHKRMADVGIQDKIALRVVDAMKHRVAGTFNSRATIQGDRMMQGVITLALNVSQQTRGFTLNHELVHAFKSLGLFRTAEWQALARRAKNDVMLMNSIKRRYGDLDAEGQIEEAIADMFAGWVRDRSTKGLAARAFDRILSFIGALSSWARGQGWQSAEAVMRALDSGKLGARPSRARVVVGKDRASYEDAPDSLMGFSGDGSRQKGFGQNRYPVEQDVHVTLDGETFEDTIEGLNGPHPMERGEKFSIIDDARDTLTVQAGKVDAFKGKMADAADRWRTALQDRYLPLLRTQQKVEEQLGRKLRPSENPYLREELMSGRIGARLERLTEDFMDPLFEVMHAEGVSVDELETYLYARHAQERNARIAEINPAFGEGTGSGMTDIQAMAILNRVEREGVKDKLERVASYVDRIRDWSMEVRIESGLLSEEDADTWRATYENYVPLRGRAEVDADAEGMIDRINRSGGINVRGKESRRAFGRTSRADNIIAYTLLQAEEAIVRSETNRVAQTFYKLAKQAPDDSFWKTEKVTRKPVIDPKTGLVRYEIQNRIQPEDADFTVSAKFAGKERRVTMNRENPDARRLADAMRNLTQHQMDWFVEHLGKVNRFMSAINTTWNPEFVITNAFRDIQTATVNLVGEERDGLVKAVLKDYPAALVASTKAAFDKGSGDWQRWHDEFVSQGGKVYFNRIDDIETLKKRVEQAAEKAGRGGRVSVKGLFLTVRDFVEDANDGVENAIRLSTYKNARKMGMSKVEAASLAKNVTVNFNRRGTFGPAINAAYLFFNASVQGSARIFTAMRSKRVRKMLAGVAMFGFAIELLNAMLSGDDDDGESYYDKISDFDKSRNLIIMLPGGDGKHIKIPLPYGYNVFFGAGRAIAEIGRRGGERAGATMGTLGMTIADAFNPIGGTESLLNLIAPTIADPIVDLSQNRDFTGNPIMPIENPFEPPVPDAQRYFGSVAPHWRAVTDFLSAASGGDDVVAGVIDISPETLEYLSGVVVGAAGGFADRGVGLVSKTLDSDAEVDANDIPFARKVVGGKPTWYDRSAYYDRVEQIATAVRAAKDYQERGDTAKFEGYVDSNSKIFELEADMKAAQKEMRMIRKAKAQNILAHDQGAIDDATFKSEKRVYADAEKIVFTQFNTRWNEVMSPKGDAGQE